MAFSAEELTVEELYLRHHDALRRFLTRMLRNEDIAAEVAQDAYVRIIRFAPRRLMGDPKAYLFQVAANAARDRIARERTRGDLIDAGAPSEGIACPQPNAEAVASGRERMYMLIKAVEELPPRCREVFLLSRFDELSNGEIAQRLGISRNMVEKHIIKAMVHCRRRLDAAGK
jgi:RNA polymerase sigma-70 factor (ECF subfamily)